MKLLLASLLVVAATFAHADVVVEQNLESPASTGKMVMKIKGDTARMDIPSPIGAVTTFIDTKTGDATTLLHSQKKGFKANLKKQVEAAQKQAGIDPSQVEKPTPTGKTEKVGEWNTEIYDVKTGNFTGKIWVAKDFPNYKAINEEMKKLSAASGAAGFDPAKFDLGGMIVKSEMSTPQGKVTTTLVKAVQENVPEEEFKTPEGYELMTIPGQ